MDVVIYGAQSIAYSAYKAIKKVYKDVEVKAFLVSKIGNNPSEIDGVSVKEFAEFCVQYKNEAKGDGTIKIFIATPESVMDEIEEYIKAVAKKEAIIFEIKRLDSMKWASLQQKALMSDSEFIPIKAFGFSGDKPELSAYAMVHHKDKKLTQHPVMPYDYKKMQVGAVLTDKKIAELTDDSLNNISAKNGDYCELTGLYWIWKNHLEKNSDKEKYVGFFHYRRFIDLSDDDLKRIKSNDIDVVLPYPMSYYKNIEEHHNRYLKEAEWAAVLRAIKELRPEYEKCFKEILARQYFYNYNIIIAKETVLQDYCSWLFELLFRIEKINNIDGKKEPNRYLGYVAETLETLYFMKNKDVLKIAHGSCHFIN